MDLLSLAFSFLLQHPNVATAGAKEIAKPGAVNVSQMQSSFADLSKGILYCYHKTARYRVADVIQKPWERQNQYDAENSAVIHIQYSGLSGAPYQMIVAVLSKGGRLRSAVLQDTAVVPYNKKCELENWTSA